VAEWSIASVLKTLFRLFQKVANRRNPLLL
jgi:hypothetical protein